MNNFLSVFSLVLTLASSLPVSKDINRQNITCPSITANYMGTFQDPKNDARTFDAVFQFKIYSNIAERKVHFETQHWDKSTNASEFSYYVDTDDWTYLPVVNSSVTLAQPKWAKVGQSSPFTVNINHLSGVDLDAWFHIFYQPSFNLMFSLPNAVDQCTDTLPLNTDTTNNPRPDLYHFCVCCGEYNPSSFLLCPKAWTTI
ncbi:hypothetical protein M3Y97_00938800 [Aphelenchoides bicaudatus]|nr:hypothetical protein M3Y97_00938800 [Aphelenchoides bicaudatus]